MAETPLPVSTRLLDNNRQVVEEVPIAEEPSPALSFRQPC